MKTTLTLRPLALAGVWLAASLPLAPPVAGQTAPRDAYVERGEIERRGKAWEEEVQCGATVRPGGTLTLRADMGAVQVEPGTDDRVQCVVRLRAYTYEKEEARRMLSAYEVDLKPTAGGVLLTGRLSGRPSPAPRVPSRGEGRVPRPPRPPMPPMRLGVHYELRVPPRFNLDLQTSGGEIEIERLEGEVRAVTAGGGIRTGDVSGPVRVETAGGSIQLGNIAQRVEARTAGGGIRVGDVGGDTVLETSGGRIVAGRVRGRVRAATAGGDILIRAADGDIHTQTAGGQIRLGETGGRVVAETAGGSIQLDLSRGPVKVETAGGCIYLDRVESTVHASTSAGTIRAQILASGSNWGASVLQNAFGDVEVYLPPDLPITIDAAIRNASGHKIISDFPLQIEDKGPHFRPHEVEGRGRLNGGGEVLRIRTTAGNIKILRIDAQQIQKDEKKQQWFWRRWLELRRKEKEKPDQR